MTTFGWKRKIGQNISKDRVAEFSEKSVETSNLLSDISWIQSFKRKKACNQENCKIKYEEFKTAGVKLAENQKFHEAIIEFDKALSLVPNDYKILEMKAQALLQMNSMFPAVKAAEKAVKMNPRWWASFQTLGRAQLGIGDICMAKRSFSKAIHLDPTVEELWEEDLKWTLALIKKKEDMEKQNSTEKVSAEVNVDEEGYLLQRDTKSNLNIPHCDL